MSYDVSSIPQPLPSDREADTALLTATNFEKNHERTAKLVFWFERVITLQAALNGIRVLVAASSDRRVLPGTSYYGDTAVFCGGQAVPMFVFENFYLMILIFCTALCLFAGSFALRRFERRFLLFYASGIVLSSGMRVDTHGAISFLRTLCSNMSSLPLRSSR
jgi:hypothetical protein